VVYRAWQLSLGRWVALKVLRQGDQKTLQKFQAEARLTAHLVQQGVPHVRQVYEVGQTPDGLLFVALEYVDDSLRNMLRSAQERGRLPSPLAACKLLRPVAQALDALHRLGWVHLDIKPENILISQRGGAMLADFGIAQRRGAQTHACTPAYASPEQAAGDRPVGPWSDIYALGVVLYEIVASRLPFQGEQDIVLLNQHLEMDPQSPRKCNPKLTSSQAQAILRALDKSPQKRQRTAGELVEALVPSGTLASGVFRATGLVLDQPSGWFHRIPRSALAAVLAILILAALSLLGWALWRAPSSDTPPTTASATLPPTMPSTTTPSAAPTRPPTATATPNPTEPPTSTLAPTLTRTPRPTATNTPTPAPDTPSPTPQGAGAIQSEECVKRVSRQSIALTRLDVFDPRRRI
jgi:serine/threonine-protein kinase